MFENVKLSTKLYVGFGIPVAILVAISVFAYVQADRVHHKAVFMTQSDSAMFSALAKDMKLDVVNVQQWLTDISATRAAAGYDDGFSEAEKSAQSFKDGLKRFRTSYEKENNADSAREVRVLEEKFDAFYAMGRKMATAYIEGGPADGNMMMDEFDGYSAAMQEAMAGFGDEHDAELSQSMASIVLAGVLLKSSVKFAAIAAIALVLVMSWFLVRSITKPINRIIGGLSDGAHQVNDAAGQVSSAAQQLAEGASEQASSLEESSAALEQMSAMTRANAENAKMANELSEQARTAARSGDKTMGQLNAAMTDINDSSAKISKIIKVIEEIAFQTNLLALNAAVEAARAGEHGKGFAVVADEVRSLAQRAAEAARETTGLIEDSVGNAREGTDVAGEVGKSLTEIVTDVSEVANLVNNITQASEEQAEGVSQVNAAVSQMDKLTQQSAAIAEESASAAEQLSAQAKVVLGVVENLTVVIHGRSGAARRAAAGDPTRSARGATPRPTGSGSLLARKRPRVLASAPDTGVPLVDDCTDF